MKYISTVLILFLVQLLQSCEAKKTSKANIFERKEVAENRIMIKYSFFANGKTITDSTIIENKVLDTDSLPVVYDPENPIENTLQIP